jgi:hypothetical protein
MVVSGEINEGIHCCIVPWWEANRKNEHLNVVVVRSL